MGTPTETSAPLRVGLVGYGLAGSAFHAPLIATTPGLRLQAVVTADPGRRAEAARDHPGVHVVADTEQLLADPAALDLVVVASPNHTHLPVARAALAAGLPVVVDKPLAATAAQARALADQAKKLGLLLTVFQNRRWDADFRTVQQLLAQGALGTVHRYESRFERWRPQPAPGWKENPDPAWAGGILYDLGSHLVDQALQLFGLVDRVYAETDVRRPGALVEDDAFIALTHAGGVRSHLWMSALTGQPGPRLRVQGDRAGYTAPRLDPQEAALRAGLRPGPHQDTAAWDTAARGTAASDPEAPDTATRDTAAWGAVAEQDWGVLGTPDDAKPHPSLPGDYPAFYSGVVAALRHGAAAPVDPEDAVAALTVLEAARRSAASGRTVELAGAQPAEQPAG
ncbi:Gfo/Idh/MocA family oxidoreductase [Kitasatospora kifunensis]|uniref:Putative dehydrogenase n=1 Tax=Kitasatospora kifunensis TaxID=58351 RepID=A0A7W7QXW5_KITKI|nr:Gfo/Idh/MocA family oxidoreductase [Kitasatospora kifunensis]MBB4921161.1 putative dehydrogenase [Kitasatospora kifunensis]